MFVSESTNKSWSIQRVLNRYPIWSKIRLQDDSTGRHMLNSVGLYFDEMWESLLDARKNWYIDRSDVLQVEKLYVLDLPRTFAFTEANTTHDRIKYVTPTIEATSDSQTVNVSVTDASIAALDKASVLPTRLNASMLSADFENLVIPTTEIIDLSSVSIENSGVESLGSVYVEVDDAIQFGEILSDGTSVTSKVIIKGVLYNQEDTVEEHISVRSNGEKPSRNRWKSIESIETHGIYDESTTIKVHCGFDKRYVRETNSFWEDELRESLLFYDYSNEEYDGNILPLIQFKVAELTDTSLRARGLGDDTVEYEFGLMKDFDTFFDEEIVGIEKLEFTNWLLVATPSQLHVVSGRMPHMFNWIHVDDNGNNIVAEGLKSRSLSAELQISANRNWLNYSEYQTSLFLETRHIKPVRGIRSTRLSIVFDSPALSGPVTKYFDWNGNEININTDPARGWIFNSHAEASPTDWNEKKLTLDVASIVGHPAWVAVVRLEAKMSDGASERDVYVVHSDARIVDTSLDWPAEIVGNVNGITYDASKRLIARTIDNEVWTINLFWDYCFVDYRTQQIFFREEYDSVEVSS